jgi:anti-sigma B factor antagonist
VPAAANDRFDLREHRRTGQVHIGRHVPHVGPGRIVPAHTDSRAHPANPFGGAPGVARVVVALQNRGMITPDSAGDPVSGSALSVAARHTEHDGALVTVLAIDGDVDLASYRVLRVEATRAVRERPSMLVLDLTGCGFLSSIGLAILVGTQREAGPGTTVRVVAGSTAA